jgi:hypothetical protein
VAEAYYEPIPATDSTFAPEPGAVFEVFELSDRDVWANPLPLRVGDGTSNTSVEVTSPLGTLPGVHVTSPNFKHIWKSGTFQWERHSIDGAEKNVEAARIAADNSALDASNSAQAAIDAANLVDAPADVAIETAMKGAGTVTGAYLDAEFSRVKRVQPNQDLQAAINSGGRVRLVGVHMRTTQLTIPSNTYFDAEPGAVLDISGMAAGVAAVAVNGSLGTPVALSSDATEGGTTIAITDATGLTAGDYVKVSSNQVWGTTNGARGEIVRIASISTNTLTLEDPLQDSYPVASDGKVERVTFAEGITIDGIRFVGGPTITKDTVGLDVKVAKNLRLINLTSKNCHRAAVYLSDTILSSVTGCHFEDSRMAGLGYGIGVLYASQDVTITNCTGVKMRHLVMIGGGTSRRGISRRIAVSNCTASQMDDAGFDAHPTAEYISFIGCHVHGSGQDGIIVQSARFTISGCTVSGATRHGIIIQNFTIRGIEGTVSNNVVTGSTSRGITLAPNTTAAYRVWNGLTISGNTVNDSAGGIYIDNSSAEFFIEGVVIVGNVVRRSTSHAVYLRGLKSPVVEGNHILRAASTFEVCYLFNSPEAVISGNVLDGDGVSTRALRLVTSPSATITGNLLKQASGQGVLTDTASTGLVYMGNRNLCTTKGTLSSTGNVQSTADASGAYNL